jgi:6-phospho-3-hexuloisomerase
MNDPHHAALAEISAVLDAVDDRQMEAAVMAIRTARRIAVYGVGREGLMMKALAMRLHHLGCDVAIVGDMTAPPLGSGDLLLVSAGPGGFSTVEALMRVARDAGARIFLVTAQPGGPAAALADGLLVLPAQTMADDRGSTPSVLPMGSLYEGAEYVAFEMLVLRLREALGVDPAAMRARHTNLE